MFTKLLILTLVVLGVWVAFRVRTTPPPTPRPPAHRRPSPTLPTRPGWLPAGAPRALAYGLVSMMLAAAGLYLFEGWEARRRPVTVRVINANTGTVVTYQVSPKDVTGRSFRTLDGRRVTLADVERMEISASSGP
jgi:hypothetical protein